jgi:dimethylargininase
MTVALVRPPGASFASAISAHPQAGGIDVARAREQHAAYVDALRAAGLQVVVLPAADDLPDACFVEDTAVVLGRRALLCRPGAAARQAEVDLVREPLAAYVDHVAELPPGATLDGGDVLRLGDLLYVGRSARTSDAGISALTVFAAAAGVSVRTVGVPAGFLHLQTAVTALDDSSLVGVPAALKAFPGALRVVQVPAGEEAGASVLAVAGHVVMAAGAPVTAAAIRALRLAVHEVALGEFTKADGGPTCLSLRVPARG